MLHYATFYFLYIAFAINVVDGCGLITWTADEVEKGYTVLAIHFLIGAFQEL